MALFMRPTVSQGGEAECLHYFRTIYGRLEITQMVALIDRLHFLQHITEIAEVCLHFPLVAGGDVGPAQCHEVVKIIAGVGNQASHG